MSEIRGLLQSWPIFSMDISYEQDIVQARQKARRIASHLHYDLHELTHIATAVSELVRYAYKHSFTQATFSLIEKKFRISVWGAFPAQGGLRTEWIQKNLFHDAPSLDLIGARRLMDEFCITPSGQGIELSLTKALPLTFPLLTTTSLDKLRGNLGNDRLQDPYEEIKLQNRELIFALNALRNQQMELEQLNKELAETNQGVLALYAELEDKALSLQKASEAKSLFFSNMTHEFRTPLNSAKSLLKMLLERQDGELTLEQERQVVYIQKAVEDLAQMVNDLLDNARLESGKILLRLKSFHPTELFATLRGMFRPLACERPKIQVIFEDVQDLPNIVSDESKVAQILRNFISNALKNTESGEIRVTAHMLDARHVSLDVADTGVGIAEDDQDRIFEEFIQLESIHNPFGHGSGLGLPLSRRLADLLGGRILLNSRVGVGSTFSLVLPLKREETQLTPLHQDSLATFEPILSREGMSETFPAAPLTELILHQGTRQKAQPFNLEYMIAIHGPESSFAQSKQFS